MYTGALPPVVESLAQILELAMQYELEGLVKSIAERMVKEVSIDNVKGFMNSLKSHSAKNASAKNAFDALLKKMKASRNDELMRASY